MLLSGMMIMCGQANSKNKSKKMEKENIKAIPVHQLETATLGGGCYWCLEAYFQRLEGVVKVASGFSGGSVRNPTYEEVCTGKTGHAEVIQITFDTTLISFTQLLKVFFTMHDPTPLNRQGNDIGTQYRSAIFYHSEAQQQQAEATIAALQNAAVYDHPIVTEVKPFDVFYKADEEHQNYYNDNSNQPYCRYVIQPKLEKMEAVFKELLKK